MYRVFSSDTSIGIFDCEDFRVSADIRGDRHARLLDGHGQVLETTSAIQTDPIQLVDMYGHHTGWAFVTRLSIYVLVSEDEGRRSEKENLKRLLLQLANAL